MTSVHTSTRGWEGITPPHGWATVILLVLQTAILAPSSPICNLTHSSNCHPSPPTRQTAIFILSCNRTYSWHKFVLHLSSLTPHSYPTFITLFYCSVCYLRPNVSTYFLVSVFFMFIAACKSFWLLTVPVTSSTNQNWMLNLYTRNAFGMVWYATSKEEEKEGGRKGF